MHSTRYNHFWSLLALHQNHFFSGFSRLVPRRKNTNSRKQLPGRLLPHSHQKRCITLICLWCIRQRTLYRSYGFLTDKKRWKQFELLSRSLFPELNYWTFVHTVFLYWAYCGVCKLAAESVALTQTTSWENYMKRSYKAQCRHRKSRANELSCMVLGRSRALFSELSSRAETYLTSEMQGPHTIQSVLPTWSDNLSGLQLYRLELPTIVWLFCALT